VWYTYNMFKLNHQTDRFIRNLFITFAGILSVYIIFWVGTEIRNNLREYSSIGRADRPVSLVSIQGTGDVYGVPTLAKINVGLLTQAPVVATAQGENTTKMNDLQQALRALGVPEDDMQTQGYSIYPSYSYTDGVQQLMGYEVNHMLEIRIRDLEKIGDVLQLATSKGANQISGVEFTVEDKEALLAEARREALAKVQVKIKDMASMLGVRVVRVAGFNEYVPTDDTPIPFYAGGIAEARLLAPEVSSGSEKVEVVVTVDFELE